MSYGLLNGKVTRGELQKFIINSADFEFLFGAEIESYIKEVRKKSQESIFLETRLSSSNLDEKTREQLAQLEFELMGWFEKQLDYSRGLFRKYLHFSINKNPI